MRPSRGNTRKERQIQVICGNRPSVLHRPRPPTAIKQVSLHNNKTNYTSCQIKTDKNDATVLTTAVINFQSILPKKCELWNLINLEKPDIIFGTETWLSQRVFDAELFPPNLGYIVFRKDREDGYGGVLIATKNNLTTHEILHDNNSESVFVKIKLKTKSLTLGCVYRTPSNNTLDQMEILLNTFDKLDKDDPMWIGGDINLPDIDWSEHRVTGHQYPLIINTTFLEKVQDMGLTQINNTPTRGTNILDLFFTNRPDLVTNCKVIPSFSDHGIVMTQSKINATITKKEPRSVLIWKKANTQAMREETNIFTETFLKETHNDIDKSWESIQTHLDKITKTHIPSKHTSKRFRQPWVTKELKKLSRLKSKAWAVARSTKCTKNWEKYKRLKKITQLTNRKAYQSYIKTLVGEKSDKKLWNFIKSKKCDLVGVAPLERGTEIASESVDKANVLNDYFCSVFTTEKETFNLAHRGRSIATMAPITVSKEGVQKLMEDLNPSKSAGPDEIPNRLLQTIAQELAPVMTKMFQMSLDAGALPSIWKHALVQPVYKSGDRKLASNYRPISLTCTCCKMLEHIIRTSITEHLHSQNIICDSQHGFRKQRSCETQLISIIHDLTSNLDKCGQTDVILLDFAKAFDKVPHQRLLYKLKNVGIDDKTLRWINAFLSDRTQQVVIDGALSKTGHVTSGVPQGSVLGPTMFIIYINDLPENILSNVRLFADDTILYKNINSIDDCKTLNTDLSKLQQWEERWLMEFNVKKCHVLKVTNKKSPINYQYYLHNERLSEVDSAKYLGLHLTKNLKWDHHISKITSKANKVSSFLLRNLKGCPQSVQVQCFKSMVRPILEYANTVWDPYTQKHIDILERVQKRAARRIVGDFRRSTSATNLTACIGLEPLQQRRKITKLVTFFKVVNNKVGLPLPKEITPAQRRTRGHSRKLIVPPAKKDAHLHSFFPSAVRVWNVLHEDAVEVVTVEDFKEKLGAV